MAGWLFILLKLNAQVSTDRQVINSNGGTSTAIPNFQVDYSVGEAVIVTGSTATNYYTQGFIQPDTVFASAGVFSVNIFYGSESCQDANDAYISASPVNANGPVSYLWFPTLDTGSLIKNLSPGMYILTAMDTSGASITDTITIAASTSPCSLEFFNGVTPNNDGKNDFFYIGNIESYPENSLFIFNRYGTKVWQGDKYDNVNVVFTGKGSDGAELPPATYFYILVIGGKQQKGWLELLR